MKFDCETFQDYAKSFSLITACDVVRDGSLRLSTPFQYPDGTYIDVFVAQPPLQGELYPPAIVISDKGRTVANLLDVHVKPWTTQKRKQLVADICASLDVAQNGGEFLVRVQPASIGEFPQAVVRLAQACIRVSDIAFTQRSRSPGIFQEEVEEFISSIDLPYSPEFRVIGRFGNEIEFPFMVEGRKVRSLLQTLSTSNQSAAHTLANEVYIRWDDVPQERQRFQFITLYDTNNDVIREVDFARLKTVSDVIGFPAESQRLKEALAA